jgi:hypothetical protein
MTEPRPWGDYKAFIPRQEYFDAIGPVRDIPGAQGRLLA